VTAAQPIPDAEGLRAALLGWYRAHGRKLAFRGTTAPWAILVSEFMAQQTQAARAAKAWQEFLALYPTPAALAAATPADAIRAWRGLGYNRRAIALRAAAIAIVERHAGQVPADLESLDALPGVGPYTARAVAALAYGARVGPVDTNVRRVLGRARFAAPVTPRELQAEADALAPARGAGEWTHALMDIGATFCKPRNPRCEACPARTWCAFAASRRSVDEPAEPALGRAVTATGRRAAREPPFSSTSRWLRGRILDRLRDAPGDDWTRIDAAIGGHEPPQVDIELDRLALEGLAERHPTDRALARLPLA
jgi:A/G-specific adenine glycosylase